MKHLALLAIVPLLLAPVRYQSGGGDTVTLPPAQGPSKEALTLPAAAPLGSPTIITLSPTLVSGSPTYILPSPTTPKPAQVVVPAGPPMPAAVALICRQAMETLAELSLLSYQKNPSQPLVNLTIAATAAAAQASVQQYPALGAVKKNLSDMSYFASQAGTIRKTGATALKACANPAPGKATPGSQVPVERPN